MRFSYYSDSEQGFITARSWGEAKAKLDALFTKEALDDGAYGRIENPETGELYDVRPTGDTYKDPQPGAFNDPCN